MKRADSKGNNRYDAQKTYVTDSDVPNDVLYAGSHDGTPNNNSEIKDCF